MPEPAPEALEFNAVKVFSATMSKNRDGLGERVTDWMQQHPASKVVDAVVTQSSDSEFHCLTIVLFMKET